MEELKIKLGKKEYSIKTAKRFYTLFLISAIAFLIIGIITLPLGIGIIFLGLSLFYFYLSYVYHKSIKLSITTAIYSLTNSSKIAEKIAPESVKQETEEKQIIKDHLELIKGTNEILNEGKIFEGSDFPETDEKGMKLLKILYDVRLTGVTKNFDGINPQDVICDLFGGEKVILEHRPMKKYPSATIAFTENRLPLGWLPESFIYQDDIAKRLKNGTTVYAYVSDVIGGDDDKNYGCLINIGRYEKKRATQKANIN